MSKGKPVAVTTTIKVPLYVDEPIDEAKIKREEEASNRFFALMDTCRKQVADRQVDLAVETCSKTIQLSFELNPTRKLERVDAYRMTGHALFLKGRFNEALANYQMELAIMEKAVEPYDADLAAARYHVANGLWGSGRTAEARQFYEKSEANYRQAIEHIESEFLKNDYARRLKNALNDHAAMLRQMGLKSEAESLEKEAAAIIIKTGLKDD